MLFCPFRQQIQRLWIKTKPIDDHYLRQGSVAGTNFGLVFHKRVYHFDNAQSIQNIFHNGGYTDLIGLIFNFWLYSRLSVLAPDSTLLRSLNPFQGVAENRLIISLRRSVPQRLKQSPRKSEIATPPKQSAPVSHIVPNLLRE